MDITKMLTSSTGSGIALRIKAFVALIIPILNILLENLGVNLVAEEIDGIIDAGFVILFAVLQVIAWTRVHIFKKLGKGKYQLP